MSETRKLAAILVADVVGYSRLAGRRRGSHARAASGAAQRSDRSRHRRPSRPDRQAHRRRQHHRVPQRRRRGALRDRGPKRHGRAQCRRAARSAHRIPRRHPSRRRGRGERRRPHGRRRQYRRAAGRHCEPGGICLSEDAYRQVQAAGSTWRSPISAQPQLKNIAEPMRAYSLQVGVPAKPKPAKAGEARDARSARASKRRFGARRSPPRSRRCWSRSGGTLGMLAARRAGSALASKDKLADGRRGFRSSCCHSTTSAAIPSRTISPMG